MTKNAIIITGGQLDPKPEFYKKFINTGDIIITADYGTQHALDLGITPDFIVGDMDSINPSILNIMKDKGIKIDAYDTEKDYTDTELAINKAIEYTPANIFIFGAIGDRLDHTLANVHLLKYCLDKGYNARLINSKNDVMLINSRVTIFGHKGDTVSLLPLSEKVSGIETQGLYYPLKEKTIHIGSTRGISNVMTGDEAEICIKSGFLLIFKMTGVLL